MASKKMLVWVRTPLGATLVEQEQQTEGKETMGQMIDRETMIKYLKDYRKYLRDKMKEQDGADMSFIQFQGAIKAVDCLIYEVTKEKV
jgi:hypothetical protein